MATLCYFKLKIYTETVLRILKFKQYCIFRKFLLFAGSCYLQRDAQISWFDQEVLPKEKKSNV